MSIGRTKCIKKTPELVQDMGHRALDDPNQALCFLDPLVEEMNMRIQGWENQCWVDPMVLDENIDWNNVVSDDSCFSHQNIDSPLSTPNMGKKSSRPRGRPRKFSDQGISEARKTWETAQKLGISVDDEEAVLSGLRKSKRISIMEGKGA